MWQSLRYSNLFLRLGLAFVFLWFGIDKFFHPGYWLNAWVPASIVHMAAAVHITANTLVYSIGVFELLTGISLLANMYIGFFGSLSILFLATIPFFSGFNEVLVRDIGLIGGLLSLVFWPSPRYR
jgi:uncharacterized membrane protein